MQSKKVIIMDLDGTLSKVNTFTLFVKVFFRMSAVSRLNLTGIVLARKLRFISHAGAKQRIVSLFRRKGDGAIIEKTVEKIVANIRHDLLRIALASDLSVLATAAPSLYARTLAERLGFGDVVATRQGQDAQRGNAQSPDLDRAADYRLRFDDCRRLLQLPDDGRHAHGRIRRIDGDCHAHHHVCDVLVRDSSLHVAPD